MISISELPEGWGLLEYSSRGISVTLRSGQGQEFAFKSSAEAERSILMSLIRRFGGFKGVMECENRGSVRCYTYMEPRDLRMDKPARATAHLNVVHSLGWLSTRRFSPPMETVILVDLGGGKHVSGMLVDTGFLDCFGIVHPKSKIKRWMSAGE